MSIPLILVLITLLLPSTLPLDPDKLIDMLKDQQVTPPPPPKEPSAVLLGQLLRKFLEMNFGRMSYDLHRLNSTLSNITQTNEQQANQTQDNFQNITKMIKDLHESIDIIRIIMPQINSIQKTVRDVAILSNLSVQVQDFRREVGEGDKRNFGDIRTLLQLTNSTAQWVNQIHGGVIRRKSCLDLLKLGEWSSGVQLIWPRVNSDQPVHAYCDMSTDGGGWTIIQRRGVGNLSRDERPNFNRNWIEYEAGFGRAEGDHWLGLENIRSLTRNCPHELLINLTDSDNQNRFAHYEEFYIGSKLDFYRLSVQGHSGNVEDSLLYHNAKQFSTFDEDNDDKWGDLNSSCAKLYGGGWWFGDCLKSNLNGAYSEDDWRGRIEKHKGIRWNSWTTMKYSLRGTEMKIRAKGTC